MPLGWGCCCGAKPCPLFSDDFERADSGTIGNGWTENAGAWEILSGALRTASASARVSHSLTGAFSASNLVSGRVRSSASGDKIRLHLTSSLYLELKVGTGATLALVNGVTVWTCNVTAAAASWHTLQIVDCASLLRNVRFSGILAYLNGALIGFTSSGGTIGGGSTFNGGFGTGATVTGNVDCDDFQHAGMELYNERQDIHTTGSPTGGTFTLDIAGYGTTGAIAFNANAAAVKTAVEVALTLTTFAPVAVTGTLSGGGTASVFLGGLAAGKDVPLMTIGTNSLTGGTSPSVSIAAVRDGDTCAECYSCHPLVDDRLNGGQLKFISSGWASGTKATGVENLNGTFFLDPVGVNCTDGPAAGNCSAGGTPSPSPCQCYEVDVNFTITDTNTFPAASSPWNIVRIRAYAVGTTDTKNLTLEYVDSAGVSRVRGTTAAGCLNPLSLSSFFSCFRGPAGTDVADNITTGAAKTGTLEAA